MRIYTLLRPVVVALAFFATFTCHAIKLTVGDSLYSPDITGIVRPKYELRTSDGAGRFVLKNAIFGIQGNIHPTLTYRLEVDLHNDGKVKMRNAYGRFTPRNGMGSLTFGLMRVPFGYDVIRSPHQQFFANRSYVAKYGANVRETGLNVLYHIPAGFPLTVQGGVFSGASTRDDDDSWSTSYVFAGRINTLLARHFGFAASVMHTRPDLATTMHYGIAAAYTDRLWHIEGEYVYKTYSHDVGTRDDELRDTHIADTFVRRLFPIDGSDCLSGISAAGRYDYISRFSMAKTSSEPEAARHRMTVGGTLHFGFGPVRAETRINYEKCFYPSSSHPAPDDDRIVIELMCRF